MTSTELKYTLGSALIVILLMAAYGLRVVVKGRVHFERIDRQGGSRLLSAGAMHIGYWVLHPVGHLFAFLGITPNTISWTSLGFGFLAGACLAGGHFGYGAILATISGLLDSLDGMVARISGAASNAGEVLDAAVDRCVEFFFLAGVVVHYRAIPGLQILALMALFGSFMVSYSSAKAEALGTELPRGSMRRPERAVYLTLGAALSAVTVFWWENDYPMVLALVLVAVGTNVSSVRRLWFIAKAVRVRDQEPGVSRAERSHTEVEQASQTYYRAGGWHPASKSAPVIGRSSKPSLLVSLRRSQIASLSATVVDFASLIFLVEFGRVWYVAATAAGALFGAIVNFMLGRHWTFMANHEAVRGQAIRYAGVAAISLALNSVGVYLLTEYLGIHYAMSKVITAFLVGLLFNFPLHRRFVFKRHTYA
jgi:phosphatidylglycerophosphate synthase/putative flippase GtrA